MTQHTLAQFLAAPPLWFALALAGLFALLAYLLRALTRGGAAATFAVGFVVFGLGGGRFAVPLLAFFLSSSLLSKLGAARKRSAGAFAEKGATRDAGQVWANGSVAVALVLAYALVVHRWPIAQTRTLLMLYLAALATVNADTWATEIGALARKPPRLLSNWKPAPPGTSGAISGLGLVAGAVGSAFIPLVAWTLWHLDAAEALSVGWAGFLGCLADSILGASVQAQYRDPATGDLTERAHPAGQPAQRARGLAWINNDVVNFLASLVGTLCAWALLCWAAYPLH